MDRTKFIIATAIILFAVFILGWLVSSLLARFSRVPVSEMDEVERLSQRLHDVESQRDRAVTELEMREAELTERLSHTSSELRSALDGLRDSRNEIEELRDYIERKLAKNRQSGA
ncbi:hypothetical protein [Paracoccus aminophilus]|uniref:Membrane-bound metallopeptidase n=1 Tax=Paracoccus aminophilus JCM 7686 TaxID=1367847 RepID=S5Y8A2_PARAH|nr:hypothetical protein [Paracoccus aminophilus]AGT07543.1 hypothetical protein JCM7686_0434 [Paracoccus aminophilus JCM 7686]